MARRSSTARRSPRACAPSVARVEAHARALRRGARASRRCWSATTRPRKIYVAGKHKACEEVGIRSIGHELPADTPEEELLDLVDELNADDAVSGIIVQLPLPDAIDPARVIAAVDPLKDVDGLTPDQRRPARCRAATALVPATPSGVMELLRRGGHELEGARGGRRRPLRPGRQAGRLAAARRERDRHDLPLAHARPRRGLPPRRRAGRGRGQPALITGDMVKAGRP